MARNQALTGFKPIGPHTGLVRDLLGDVTAPCLECGGTGLSGSYGGMGWRACPACHGFGVVYAISLEELQARRQKVLESYLEAGISNWRPGVPIRCPVQDLATGEIIDACATSAPEPVQGELPL
jgi:hypothetical protein